MAIPHFNPYYLTAALLGACTIIGIIVAARFSREVEEDSQPTTTKDLLGPLEQAYYSGLMHPEEIERIRESLNHPPVLDAPDPQKSARVHRPTRPDGDMAVADDPYFTGSGGEAG